VLQKASQDNYTGYAAVPQTDNIILFNSVLTLLRHFISGRINFLFIPSLHFANRNNSGWALVFSLLFFSASPAYAESPDVGKPPDITIVQSEDGGPYEEFSIALRKILSSRGFTHIVIDSASPNQPSGLVIAVGMKAATAVAAGNALSVLNVLIPKAAHEKLLRNFPRRAGSPAFSAIFLDQPVPRQVHLIIAILPDKHNVGLLYSSPPKELAELGQELTGHGLSLHEQMVDPALPLPEALQNVLSSSDVLLALPDAAVYNSSTIRNILLATYRSGVPLIGFSAGYVKAGALCAVFSTPEQIATQAAALIRQFRDTHVLPAAQYPQEFEVMVNEQVARSLGLHIRGASALHDEIKSESKGEP
jgi:hypothetical protein